MRISDWSSDVCSSDLQVRILATAPPQAGGIFPNILWAFIYAPDQAGNFVGALGLHTFVPKGPDKFEFYTWFFAEKGAPEDLKKRMMAVSAYNMGSSGTIEQDDTDTWPHMTRNARGAMGKRQNGRAERRARVCKYV